MEIFPQLGMALGLASLAGVNLYLTVLVVGIAVRFHLVELGAEFHSLEVLGHPVILTVAALLFALQFFADKVPLIDSLWDSVHTVIRPVGGSLLALQALGPMPEWLKIVAALLAGGAALTTHSAKAGTRLLINHSPEPVSNIAVSLTEEAAVTGGVIMTLKNPVVAFFVFAGILTLIWLILPRLWRGIRATLWLVWRKIKTPGTKAGAEPPKLTNRMDDAVRDMLLVRAGVSESEVSWGVRCLSGRGKGVTGLCANLQGVLAAPTRPDCLYFAAVKTMRGRVFNVPLAGAEIAVESRFLSENVVIANGGVRVVFCFPRDQAALAALVADRIRESMGRPLLPQAIDVEPKEAEAPAMKADSPVAAPETTGTSGHALEQPGPSEQPHPGMGN